MAIRYIKNESIDFKKWDRCIKKAFNGTIYAYSWYLNIVSENWDALVDNDYEKVMPLPNSFLMGNKIIVQPEFTGNLGIFSTTTLDDEIVASFINAIPNSYKYIRLNLNKHNVIVNSRLNSATPIAFDLDLIKPYQKLRSLYPKALNEFLMTAEKLKFSVVAGITVESVIQLKQSSFSLYSYFFPENLITLQLLVTSAVTNRLGQMCGVYDSGNKLQGAAFFAWSHQKAILVYAILNNDKLQLPALSFLIDDFIRNNSEKNLILHFEIARKSKLVPLIESIGAKKSENAFLYKNKLPWYLKPFEV